MKDMWFIRAQMNIFLRVMYFNVFFNVLNFSMLIESFPL